MCSCRLKCRPSLIMLGQWMGLCLPNRACYARCGWQKKKSPCGVVHATESQGQKFLRLIVVEPKNKKLCFRGRTKICVPEFWLSRDRSQAATFSCWAILKVFTCPQLVCTRNEQESEAHI
jgi:hypothetical protein